MAASKKNTSEKEDTKKVAEVKMDGDITTVADMKMFLSALRDKLSDRSAAPIFALSTMEWVLTLPNSYDLLNGENKEIARDIWLRLKQTGIQVKNPPLLFQ